MKRILLLMMALVFSLAPYAQKQVQKKRPVRKTAVAAKPQNRKKRPVRQAAPTRAERKVATYSNASIRGLQGQRASIQKKIKEQEQALRRNQADVKKRLEDLMILNGEIDQSQKKIDGIQKDIHHIDGNIGILQAQLKTLQQQLQDRKNKYIRSMRYMSRHHTVQDKLMFIFSAKNLTQMYRRLSFIRQYSSYQKVQGEAVKAKQKQVNEKHVQLQNVKGHKNTLLYRGKQEKTALEGKQTQQQEMVHGLQKQQKTIQAVIADQRQKDAAINAQIDRLIAQEVAKARARAAAEAKKKADAGDASCKVLRAYNIDEKVATHSYDYIVVNVLKAGNGSGCPLYTDSVKVHYSGRLLPSASYPNGKVFDQSWTGDYDLTTMMPVKFAVKGLVTGFSTALQYMHIGDRWQVIIPQQLAYGSSNTPGAAYSTLIFDVTLVAYYRANDVPKSASRSGDGKNAESSGCWIYE